MSTLSDLPANYKFSPLTEDDRARMVRGLSQRVSGSFSSLLERGPLLWRSPRELAALSLFELDPRVNSIEMTPEVATVLVDGKQVSHVPAFLLHQGSAAFVLDILSNARAMDADRAALTAALKRAYAARGIRYAVLRQADVKAEPRQRNARLVLRCRRYDMGAQTALAIIATLSRPGPHTVASVMAANPGIPSVREAVYALAAQRRVAIDLWAQRPENMAVSLAPQVPRQ